MEQARITYAFSAGKSGGHILPCLQLAKEHLATNPNAHLIFFAADSPLDTSLLHEQPVTPIFLPHAQFPGKKIWRYPTCIWKQIKAFYKAYVVLKKNKPLSITSTGELISLPVCLAGWLLGIPIELYELNALPGRTITWLSSYATIIHCCFEETKKYVPTRKHQFSPYPLRYTACDKMSQKSARKEFGIENSKKIVLILGGSQGSLFINNQIRRWLDESKPANIFIIHQTGSNDPFNWKNYYQEANIEAAVFSYTKNPALFYCVADVIICRSGAGTLFEAVFFDKKIITIPLELPGNDHQLYNALAMAKIYKKIRVVRQIECEEKLPKLLAQCKF